MKYLLLFVSVLATIFILDANRALLLPLNAQEDIRLNMATGTSLTRLAKTLKANGLLRADRDRYYIVMYGILRGEANALHAGEYVLRKNSNIRQLFSDMVSGNVRQLSITFLEGWNYRQILSALHSKEGVSKKLLSNEPKAVAAAVGIDGEHPEGWFFPNTYQYSSNTSDIDILKIAHKAMREVLEQEWQSRAPDLPYKNAYEALIMASIIEKETGLGSERPAIAGVFVRRLLKGMLLQTDPTVIYGIGPSFDGNIRRSDLLKDTPYNTYTRAGLPPTPIAAAGKAAVHAALHPEDGNTLFFVSKGDGSHQFSVTLKEHNAAVRKYQLKQ